MSQKKEKLTTAQQQELLKTLNTRFEKNKGRHKGVKWSDVQQKLETQADKIWSLYQMEETGGEPDVIAVSGEGEYIYCDCSPESPKGRRSVCYDRKALESRKQHQPHDSAIEMADAMGIEMLNEQQYRDLQKLEKFDTKTSSWIQTPSEIRELGGALFCDRRYNTVFVYHNGADSYYAARGFRGRLIV